MIRDPDDAAVDPERALAAYRWEFDPETLREVVEDAAPLRAIHDGITAKLAISEDHASRARLLGLRAVVSRALGDLDDALRDGRMAVTHAEATGEPRRLAIARVRLAHVHQWRGDYDLADRLYKLADSADLPDRLRAAIHQHAGKSCYEQGRYIEACDHFEKALGMRRGTDPELIASTELALDAVLRRVKEKGWGPYARSAEEILRVHREPVVHIDHRRRLIGFADPDNGEVVISPRFIDAYPFHDGFAWVRQPGLGHWELIDETGHTVLDASAGYRDVGPFVEDLAWVRGDTTNGFVAIDRDGTVVLGDGYDDARVFRGGVAVVRRAGRWGAVHRTGRVAVPMEYDGFPTALADGRYFVGFTADGLAVVQRDGRKGVVDRTGQVVVAPAYPELLIHPLAFLIVSETPGREADDTYSHAWGALDRRGEELVEPMYVNCGAVQDALDDLLADAHPTL